MDRPETSGCLKFRVLFGKPQILKTHFPVKSTFSHTPWSLRLPELRRRAQALCLTKALKAKKPLIPEVTPAKEAVGIGATTWFFNSYCSLIFCRWGSLANDMESFLKPRTICSKCRCAQMLKHPAQTLCGADRVLCHQVRETHGDHNKMTALLSGTEETTGMMNYNLFHTSNSGCSLCHQVHQARSNPRRSSPGTLDS